MAALQVRLFVTYLIIIGVTLGLAALSLFLLLGGYRDSISYGNLEDVGRLIDQQANAEVTKSLPAPGETRPSGDSSSSSSSASSTAAGPRANRRTPPSPSSTAPAR